MCYNWWTLTAINSNSTLPRCNQCGGELALVSQKTEKLEGSSFPLTVVTYRCLNKSCQAEIDSKTKNRMRLREEQEKARKNRINSKMLMRLNKKKILR